jgi:hypothetical protein
MHETCDNYGEAERCILGLVGNHEGKSPLGKRKSTWDDNIKMDFNRMKWEGMEYIRLAQDRDNLWVLVKLPVP